MAHSASDIALNLTTAKYVQVVAVNIERFHLVNSPLVCASKYNSYDCYGKYFFLTKLISSAPHSSAMLNAR
jgi:hypothetical protein